MKQINNQYSKSTYHDASSHKVKEETLSEDNPTSELPLNEFGNEQFEVLYNTYRLMLYRYLRLRVDSEEDAIDLTQHVFVQVLNALPSYSDRGLPIAAWLFRIARNSVTDYYRRNHNSKTVNWNSLRVLFTLQADEANTGRFANPEEHFIHQENLGQLHHLLQDLNQEKKELLALRFAAGLSSREIGLTIGKNEAAVKKQLSRILTQLKAQYREQDSAR